MLPPLIDERSKELMREFGRINAGDVRQGLWDEKDGSRLETSAWAWSRAEDHYGDEARPARPIT